jgi:hypothetical protein
MEASQRIFSAEFEPAILSKRSAPRTPVSLDARLGRGGLDRTLCRITDLSLEGARIHTYSALRRGMVIWLTLPGAGQIAATIKWADDFQAGCEFAEPLPEYIYDMLVEVAGTA